MCRFRLFQTRFYFVPCFSLFFFFVSFCLVTWSFWFSCSGFWRIWFYKVTFSLSCDIQLYWLCFSCTIFSTVDGKDWGTVASYIQENYLTIKKRVDQDGHKKTFEVLSSETGFKDDSLKKAYICFHKKKSTPPSPHSKAHGNRKLTDCQEAMVIGYLMMLSERSLAAKVSKVGEFLKLLLPGDSLSWKACYELVESYQELLQLSQQCPMSKARRDPINVNNTRAFIDAWRAFFHTHSCPDKHVINADETLLRAKKDSCGAAHLESHFKAGGSEFILSKSVIGSLIPFVSWTGTTWLLVFCLKISAEGCSKDIEVFIPTEERPPVIQHPTWHPGCWFLYCYIHVEES